MDWNDMGLLEIIVATLILIIVLAMTWYTPNKAKKCKNIDKVYKNRGDKMSDTQEIINSHKEKIKEIKEEMVTIPLQEYEALKKWNEIFTTKSIFPCSVCGADMIELIDNSPWFSVTPRPKVFGCTNPQCTLYVESNIITTTTYVDYETR